MDRAYRLCRGRGHICNSKRGRGETDETPIPRWQGLKTIIHHSINYWRTFTRFPNSSYLGDITLWKPGFVCMQLLSTFSHSMATALWPFWGVSLTSGHIKSNNNDKIPILTSIPGLHCSLTLVIPPAVWSSCGCKLTVGQSGSAGPPGHWKGIFGSGQHGNIQSCPWFGGIPSIWKQQRQS